MNSKLTLAALSFTAIVSLAHAGFTYQTFVSSTDLSSTLGNNATIGFAYAGNKFVGSVYFGANNNQLYSVGLNGGAVSTFGAPVASFSGEVYVTSSLGFGGFGNRDVYAGSQGVGSVFRFSNDGSTQGLFATGLSGGVRSIAFDPYGLYGNAMVVATSNGSIYTVDSSGVPTLLASTGEDTEGISFAPQAFGSYAAGTLFVASEGSGTLRAITPGGVVTNAVTGLPGAEMVSFVPTNLGSSGNPVEGFYAAAYPLNIQKVSATQFVPYIGSAIITQETGGHAIWQITPSGGGFTTTVLDTFPAQPEDGIFVTADVIRGSGVPDGGSTALLLLPAVALLGFARRWRRRRAAGALCAA